MRRSGDARSPRPQHIDNALTEGKEQVQQDAQAELQRILDQYRVGLES